MEALGIQENVESVHYHTLLFAVTPPAAFFAYQNTSCFCGISDNSLAMHCSYVPVKAYLPRCKIRLYLQYPLPAWKATRRGVNAVTIGMTLSR